MMSRPQPQGHVKHQYRGYVTSKKNCISTFTRPLDPKGSRMVTQMRKLHPQSHVTH